MSQVIHTVADNKFRWTLPDFYCTPVVLISFFAFHYVIMLLCVWEIVSHYFTRYIYVDETRAVWYHSTAVNPPSWVNANELLITNRQSCNTIPLREGLGLIIDEFEKATKHLGGSDKSLDSLTISDVHQNVCPQMSTELNQHKTLLTKTFRAGWGLLFETIDFMLPAPHKLVWTG